MQFSFATAAEILFGPGRCAELAGRAPFWGRNALVVTGADPTRARPALDALSRAGVASVLCPIRGEPTIDDVTRAACAGREAACSFVVAIGGGSALDAGKAAAALLSNPGDLLDYLEVVGRALPLPHPAVPCVTIPTTAGTGAEVTRNAVVLSPGHGVKVSLRHRSLLPVLAIVDPELTLSMPAHVTAATGMDALAQLIEPFVCRRPNPITDALCREAIPRAARALPRAHADGADRRAREEMAWASLCGGLALANAGLGAVHGFAAPIGGMFPGAAHGAVCAALLAPVLEVNLRALRARAPGSDALARHAEVARLLCGDPDATPEDGIRHVHRLGARLRLGGLRSCGVDVGRAPEIAAAAARASSMRANPVDLDRGELEEILEQAA